MAATRLIAMHPRQGRSVAKSLGERTDYAKNPEKTEKGDLVTTYQCDPFTVDEEFMLQKRQYYQITGKSQHSDVIAYQIRQSFKPGEVSAEEANRIGYELALRFTKGKYSFIVATHTDRAHIHNHVVFNSTSIDGTRKFKDFWRSGLALQKLSDLICLEHGLSVIERKPYDEREKRTKYPVKEGIRGLICQDIDEVLLKKPKDFDAFLEELKKAGYEIKAGKMVRGGDVDHEFKKIEAASFAERVCPFLLERLTEVPSFNLVPYSLNPATFSGFTPLIEYQPAGNIILLSPKVVLINITLAVLAQGLPKYPAVVESPEELPYTLHLLNK